MKTPLHIAFYCSSTSWGGLEMNTVRYAGWMKEEGFVVSLYCVNQTPLHDEAKRSRLDVRIIRRNGKYFDLMNAWRVAKTFRVAHVDVCWFRDTRDMDLLGWAKRFSGSRFRLLYQQAMQFGVSKKDAFHTMRFAPIDAWVSTLEFLKQQVITATKFSPTKIHVVPLGVDSERITAAAINKRQSREYYGLPEEAFVFGLIGRLDPLKGQHVAIDALRLLHEQGQKAHLLLVGESTRNEGNTYAQQIHKQILHAGLQEYVHMHPYSPDVAPFYKSIDVFLLCSKGETFGTVTVEAMACGVPVIGTNSSGTPELLSNGAYGVLVTPDSASEVARAMLNAMDNYPEIQSLANRAKEEFLRRYSKQASVQAMRNIVLSLAANT
jgi:glycosyltransferase involved in cell wall biosynthesis